MKTTIVFAHPWHGSFNKAVLDTVIQKLAANGDAYTVIDLNKDGFDPVLSEKDLALYAKGQSSDPLVAGYQQMIRDCRQLVFIFPIWWFNLPAILKGFVDKVFLKGFSHVYKGALLVGQLGHIKRCVVLTTSQSPTIYQKLFVGNPVKHVLIREVLKKAGMKRVEWYNNPGTSRGSDRSRRAFLAKVSALFEGSE